jgi:hypothetical protein
MHICLLKVINLIQNFLEKEEGVVTSTLEGGVRGERSERGAVLDKIN